MTKPFPYQLEGVAKIEHFGGRALLADSMGLGKSFQVLLWAKQSKKSPIIIVCPASLKWNWANECLIHVNLRSEILEGMKPPRTKLHSRSKVWIINYDILGPWLNFLKELEPGIVILDEAHYCKSLKALRTKNIRKLCKDVPHVIALSGTPLTNRPAELFSVLNILRPDVWNSFFVFASNFCQLRKTPWGMRYDGARNLGLLHSQLLSTVMIRRRKQDVLKDLPPKTREVVTLPIEDPEEYFEAVHDFSSWYAKAKHKYQSNKKNFKGEQMTKMGYLKRMAAKKKLPAMIEWIDTYLEETDEKLLFFVIHKSIVRALHERYEKQSVIVTGETIGRKRQKAFDQFNQDKRTRILIGNVQAAGVGWNCKATSTVAFGELDWTPGNMTQAEDRCHGLKRGIVGNPMLAYYLIGKDTIESDLCKLLQKKAKILDSTLDGVKQKDSLDIYDQLARILREQVK